MDKFILQVFTYFPFVICKFISKIFIWPLFDICSRTFYKNYHFVFDLNMHKFMFVGSTEIPSKY